LAEVFSELYDWYHSVLVGLLHLGQQRGEFELKYDVDVSATLMMAVLGQQRGEFELKYDVDVSATLMMAVLDGLWLQSLLGVVSVGKEHIETLKQVIFASLVKDVK